MGLGSVVWVWRGSVMREDVERDVTRLDCTRSVRVVLTPAGGSKKKSLPSFNPSNVVGIGVGSGNVLVCVDAGQVISVDKARHGN